MLIEVTRPYGGAEGKRVKPGTRFWVKQPGKIGKPAGLLEIAPTRYQQLKSMKLVKPLGPVAEAPPAPQAKPAKEPRSKPAPQPRNKVEPDSRPPAPSAPGPRAAAKSQSPKDPIDPAKRPGGSPAGKAEPSSSSLAGRPTKPSTLKQRGVRRSDSRSAGSLSTTPGDSAPGPSSSTPATPDGGGTTPASPDSTAFV